MPILHRPKKIYTGAARGARDKYEVWMMVMIHSGHRKSKFLEAKRLALHCSRSQQWWWPTYQDLVFTILFCNIFIVYNFCIFIFFVFCSHCTALIDRWWPTYQDLVFTGPRSDHPTLVSNSLTH